MWTADAYHKLVMADLKELCEQVGGYGPAMEGSAKRFQFQEMMRFAHKIEENCVRAIKLLNESEHCAT